MLYHIPWATLNLKLKIGFAIYAYFHFDYFLIKYVINNYFTMLRATSVLNKLSNRGNWLNVLNTRKHSHSASTEGSDKSEPKKEESKRLSEFRKKLRETTDINDLGEQQMMEKNQKDDPLPPWPDNTNPHTGEVGGPKGPEPTRYGDWERKGRVSDF